MDQLLCHHRNAVVLIVRDLHTLNRLLDLLASLKIS